jgi:hypothetical protein
MFEFNENFKLSKMQKSIVSKRKISFEFLAYFLNTLLF